MVSPQGYFGLMFLKHYLKLSDEKLLERFNTDWAMQMFCGTLLSDNEMIRGNSFVSNVLGFLGGCLDFEEFQAKIIENWKEEIPDKNVLLEDAKCYEIYIRFPTDVKLLWEACEWLLTKQIPDICKKSKIKVPHSKYKQQHNRHLAYSKLRKKSHRKTKARIRATLHLLKKGMTAFQRILNQTKAVNLSPKDAQSY